MPGKSAGSDSREIPTLHAQVTQLARETLSLCAGSLTLARKRLKQRLLKNRTLLSQLVDEVVDAAIEQCVGVAHRQENRHIFEKTRRVLAAETPSEREQTAARVLLCNLILGNGTPLRNATRPMLRIESAFHRKQASSMQVKSQFFANIADLLPNDQAKVSQVLTEEKLRAQFAAARTTVLGDLSGTDEATRSAAHG